MKLSVFVPFHSIYRITFTYLATVVSVPEPPLVARSRKVVPAIIVLLGGMEIGGGTKNLCFEGGEVCFGSSCRATLGRGDGTLNTVEEFVSLVSGTGEGVRGGLGGILRSCGRPPDLICGFLKKRSSLCCIGGGLLDIGEVSRS
jgi:hypothetical protein